MSGPRRRGPGRPKLQNKPETLAKYAVERACGLSKHASARNLGLSRRALQHLEKDNKQQLEKLITTAGEILAREGLTPAIDSLIETIQESKAQGVRGIVEETAEFLDPDTDEIVTGLVERYDNNKHKAQIGLRKLSIQASTEILKATGILPTQMPAQVIASLTVNQVNILAPKLQELLKNQALDVIDVTPEDEN